MICDPMKLSTSPNTKSSSASSSSSSSMTKDSPVQFGIPIPIICDWLNQHWEGSLDELTKPKLALIRLMSTAQKSDHSCASFTLRQVFKPTTNNDGIPSSSNKILTARNELGPSSFAAANNVGEEANNPHVPHVQGIPTPEIYESPKLTAVPVRKKENVNIQLLDINFPPKVLNATALAQQPSSVSGENCVGELPLESPFQGEPINDRELANPADAEIASTGSANGAQSEVHSSCSLIEVSEICNEYSSEGETTMYSAETAESRNYTSPRKEKSKQIGRSQSCVSYNRWGVDHKSPMARRDMLEQQRSFIHGRKMHSQGAISQRSNDYFSPTVSSVMKKRNNLEQPTRARLPTRTRQQSMVHSSGRWMF